MYCLTQLNITVLLPAPRLAFSVGEGQVTCLVRCAPKDRLSPSFALSDYHCEKIFKYSSEFISQPVAFFPLYTQLTELKVKSGISQA